MQGWSFAKTLSLKYAYHTQIFSTCQINKIGKLWRFVMDKAYREIERWFCEESEAKAGTWPSRKRVRRNWEEREDTEERKEKLGREGGSADIALSLSNEQIGKLGRFVMDKAYRDIERWLWEAREAKAGTWSCCKSGRRIRRRGRRIRRRGRNGWELAISHILYPHFQSFPPCSIRHLPLNTKGVQWTRDCVLRFACRFVAFWL